MSIFFIFYSIHIDNDKGSPSRFCRYICLWSYWMSGSWCFLLSLVFIYEILEETGWITNCEKGSTNRAPVINNQKTANWSSKADTPVPLTILAHKLWKVGNGGYAVTGTAQSSTDLSYAEVKVKFYQESGALIDSGSTLINDLAAGEKWNFKVICINTDEHVANYKITVGSRFWALKNDFLFSVKCKVLLFSYRIGTQDRFFVNSRYNLVLMFLSLPYICLLSG